MRLSIFLVVLMAVGTSVSRAETHVDRSVAELFKESDLVVEGKLVSGTLQCFTNGSCRNYYRIQPEKTHKGAPTSSKGLAPTILIHASKSLSGELTYVFFLRRAAPGECECAYFAVLDGVFLRTPDGQVLRHTSVDSFKQVSIGSRKFYTYLAEEPEFDKDLTLAAHQQGNAN